MATAATAFRGIRGATIRREVLYQRLLQLADRYGVKFRNVIQAAVRTGKAVSLERLANAIQSGNAAAVLEAIPWDSRALPALQASLPALTADLVRAGAALGSRLLPGNIQYRFDVTNPLSIQEALVHSNALVTEIGTSTREALREIIGRAIQEGLPPLKAAKLIRSTVGLRSDQLASIQALRDAGASAREIERAQARKLEERAVLIARTETLWAANEGQRSLWEQGQDAGVIPETAQREYITTPDDRLCPICEPLDGRLYGVDEVITTELGTVDSPPIHPNCRCTMSLVVP